MSDRPLVTVAIPAYKSKYFLEAISSVAYQDYPNIEILVCDDSPDSELSKILDEFSKGVSFPVRYYRNETTLGGHLNHVKCVSFAAGVFIKFLHDDDVLLPGCISSLVSVMESRPDVVLASSSRKSVDAEGKDLPGFFAAAFPFDTDIVIEGSSVLTFLGDHTVNFIGEPSCVLCRRDDLLALGEKLMFLNDCHIRWVGDLAMYANLLCRGNLALLKSPLTCFRISIDQTSQRGRDEPGIGNQGHADFRRTVRELGWYDASRDSRHVRVAKLAGLGSNKFVEFNLIEGLNRAFHTKPTSVRTWLTARTLSPVQQRLISEYVEEQQASAAQLVVVVVDLAADEIARSLSLNSLLTATVVNNVTSLVVSTAAQPPEHKGIWLQVVAQDWVASLNALLARLESDWVMLLQAGDELSPSGLQMMSLELQSNPDCRAIYGDALYRQEDGDYGVALRPDFNLDYLLSFPRGMARNWLFNRAHLVSLGGFDAEYSEAMELDLILRMVNQEGITGLGHISEPLVLSAAPVMQDSAYERAAILTHLQVRGYPNAAVSSSKAGQYQLNYAHMEQPLVSIVVIMRDEMAVTQRCVMSALESTSYANYEILLIDNHSQEASSQEWLAALEQMGSNRLQVLRSTETLSRSEANNQAALNAKGDYLLFLRPEVAVIDEHWLSELMNHALRPEVGLVGARTVDADGKVTHAGQVLGLEGPAGAIFLGEALDAPGYMQRLQVDQNIGAVSDSCMLLRKSVYIDVGGMDASSFAEAGAAVDLCLKVANSGHLLVWTPRATLLHAAQKSRLHVAIEDALYERWLPQLARDPAYNANFSLAKPGGFKLADPQISWRPLETWHPLPTALVHPADMYGCGHYRMMQPFNALREAGIMDGALSMGLMHVTDLERYAPDVVVLQRQIGDERLEAMRRMKAFSKAFKVYELDDYLPNLPLKSAHRSAMPKDIIRSLRRGLAFVDRFVVSTEPLAEVFAGFHDDIRVVKNRLDPRWWATLPASARGVSAKPRVGWAGGASHTGDLELILDVVKELASEVEWVFFGMCPDKLRPYVHEFHKGVSIDQYPRMLASLNLDLALAPLEENLFNECKSNLRLLEYGVCKYPVVCSDVRCYEGSLPATRVKNRYRDWMDAIRMHLSDPVASQAQGLALYEAVRKDWMLQGDGLEAWRQGWLP